jgi:hypothetical protein
MGRWNRPAERGGPTDAELQHAERVFTARAGITRLQDESTQLVRRMWSEANHLGYSGSIRPPDPGALVMLRQAVADAAHLNDDVLQSVANLLDRTECAEPNDYLCTLEQIEKGLSCPVCRAVYELRCIGFDAQYVSDSS